MYFPASAMYFRQAFCAAWNCGEDISRPCGSTLTPWAFTVGSGKFVMPCERMQSANLSISGEMICCCAAVSSPPFGSRCRHALYADAGAWKPAVFVLVLTNCPWLLGSGQSGAPCERMQFAYPIAICRFDRPTDPAELPEPPH